MKLGKINFIFFLLLLNFSIVVFGEDKISTVPLINLENLEPSFESEDLEDKDSLKKSSISLKEKKLKN